MNSVGTEDIAIGELDSVNRWHLTDYLISLGMKRDDVRAWVRARRQGRSFKASSSDSMGEHLDRVWKRMQVSEALQQLKSAGEVQQGVQPDRMGTWRRILAVLSIYCCLCWLYVIVFQMVNLESPYWPLAVWLPTWVRMDYFGETNFLLSFLFAVIWAKLKYWSPTRRIETDN